MAGAEKRKNVHIPKGEKERPEEGNGREKQP